MRWYIKMRNKCQINQRKLIKLVKSTPEVTKNYKNDASS